MRTLLIVVVLFFMVGEAEARRRNKCRNWGTRNRGQSGYSAPQQSVVVPPKEEGSTDEQRMLQLVNNFRAQHGRGPVELTDQYNSDGWAQSMASRGRMHHANNFYGAASENVAMNSSPSPDRFFRQWVNSSGHRANMLNGRWRFLDYGQVGGYACQRFR